MKTNREKTVINNSIISIASTIVLAGFKAAVGLLANSISIVSDAINNTSDALSSIITIVGTKLACKDPDKKYPYGNGRIEHLTSFIVSAIVLYAGITAIIESIKKIIEPEDPDYNIFTIIVLVAGIITKFVLGIYVKKKGHSVNSDSLVASGADAFNDALLSISVLASAVIFMIFHVNLEAYVGVLVSIFIIKAGVDLIRDSIDNILGTRAESELTKNIKKDILSDKSVHGVYDLVLNDYGPDKYLGSVHIEVPDTLTVAEVDTISRRITSQIMQKYGVILHTIGVYSINTTDKNVMKIKQDIHDIVFSHDGILEMHGFYLNETDKVINLDIIIDFKVKNREAVYRKICDEIQAKYKKYKINITLDVDASD